jgi:hypothetical protein
MAQAQVANPIDTALGAGQDTSSSSPPQGNPIDVALGDDTGQTNNQAQPAPRPIPSPLKLGESATPPSSGFLTPEALKYVPEGFAKTAGETVNTVSKIINKIPGIGETLAPSQGISSAESMEGTNAEPGSQEEMGQALGGGLENVFEFYLADAALKGLTVGDKALGAARLIKAVEGSPDAAKALSLGMRAVRGGVSGAGVAKLHGASNVEALEAGALGAGTEFGAGLSERAGTSMAEAKNSQETQPPHEVAARNLAKAVNPQIAEWPSYMRANADEGGNVVAYAMEHNRPLHTQLDYAKAARSAADETRDVYRKQILEPVGNDIVSVAGTNYKGPRISEGQDATLNAVDRRITQINKELSPGYIKTETGKVMTAIANEAELDAERSALTHVLYKELAIRTGIDPEKIAAVRQRFGKMYTIADQTEAAVNQRESTVSRQKEGRRDVPLTATSATIEGFNRVARGGPEGIADRAFRKALPDIGDIPTTELPEVKPQVLPARERAKLPTSSGREIGTTTTSPEEIAAQKEKLAKRAAIVKNARDVAAKEIQANKASHGPRGVSDATGEP